MLRRFEGSVIRWVALVAAGLCGRGDLITRVAAQRTEDRTTETVAPMIKQAVGFGVSPQPPVVLTQGTYGVVNDTSAVVVFNAATLATTTIPIPSADHRDVSVMPDQSLAFALRDKDIWVIDLTQNPPALAAGINPIVNPTGSVLEDSSLTADGRFLVINGIGSSFPIGVINTATRTLVGTFRFLLNHNSVEVCGNGSVLVTSWNFTRLPEISSVVKRLTINAAGTLVDTDESLASLGTAVPLNVTCAPGGMTGVVADDAGILRSFLVNGMTLVSTQVLPGAGPGINVSISGDGTRLFGRRSRDFITAYHFNSTTGVIGAPLWSTNVGARDLFFGVEQMAVHPDGSRVFASIANAVQALNANTGALEGIVSAGDPTGIAFTYVVPPAVSSIAPISGPPAGGTAVAITGTGFVTGATVAIGGVAATSVVVVNATTITATTGAHAAGTVNVVVMNPDSQNGTLTSGFRYVAAHLLDLNSDRAGDVFLYNKATGARRFELTNRTTTGFIEIASAWDPGWQIHPANLNADALTDFFLYDPTRGVWVQALNHAGDGTFTYTVGNWDRRWTVMPADLDGDGLTDLFVYDVGTGVWVKCFVDGSGGFKAYRAGKWDVEWTFATADLNGDGRDDFFLYNSTTGIWVEALSQAGLGTFDYPASGQWDPGWQVTPDLNGDGRTDLFLLNAAGGHVSALSRTSGDFDYVGGPQWASGWSVSPGDLNGDGATDLFLYNATNGIWVEAFSDGAGGFTYVSGQWDPGWSVAMTDRDGDGRGDLILSRADGTWVQATNTGAGTFTYAVGNWATGWTVYSSKP